MKKACLTGIIAIPVIFAVCVSSAFAHTHQLFTKNPAEGGELLRSVTSGPFKNQPDALEFNNSGPMTAILSGGKGLPTEVQVNCSEVEFGTTVVSNVEDTEVGKIFTPGLVKLAMPFGVAEGEECIEPTSGSNVPTYFDTTGGGAVPATITLSSVGGVVKAKIEKLKLSENFQGTWCTESFNIEGTLRNPTEKLVEEKQPNLTLEISNQPFSAICLSSTGAKFTAKGVLFANFFLDTMSTLTDTAWAG
jgi:hypothetical protein